MFRIINTTYQGVRERMGTDMHGWIEYKDETGKWTDAMTIGLPRREYELFSLMAGARCIVPALFDLRGIPDDASWYGREVHSEGGDHSWSWLTTEELKLVRDKLSFKSTQLNAWIAAMEIYGESRLIFGFDS